MWGGVKTVDRVHPLMLLCSVALSLLNSVGFAYERPNILLIVSEDNGQELGCYGEPFVRTPELDGLADSGIRFHNAYVPQAGCSQSRAALLTGLYPHQNGQIGLATWKFRMYRPNTPNLVQRLKSAGYRTGIIGKLHVNPESAFPFDMHEIPSANFSRKHLHEYAERASEYFELNEKPFFLSVNYPDAHRPFVRRVHGLPQKPLSGDGVRSIRYFGIDSSGLREQTANYYNCMSRLDTLIGELLEALEQSGKSEKTLVVYMGDHGADLLRGKRTSYEGGLRVPLLLRWPGRIQPGQVREELVSTLDLLPSLLDVSEAESIPDLPGKSLVPFFSGEEPDWREYLYTEYHTHSAHNFYPQRTIRGPRFKLIQNLMPGEINPGHAFTMNRFFATMEKDLVSASELVQAAYQRMERPHEFELYDLQQDPYEFDDLSSNPEYLPQLTGLKIRLRNWREQTADPLLDAENLSKLKQEIEACFDEGVPAKSKLNLTYPNYFFSKKSNR